MESSRPGRSCSLDQAATDSATNWRRETPHSAGAAAEERVHSPLILSLSKDGCLAQDRPFDSPLVLSLSKDGRLAQDRPFDSPLILSLSKAGRLVQDRPFRRAAPVSRAVPLG